MEKAAAGMVVGAAGATIDITDYVVVTLGQYPVTIDNVCFLALFTISFIAATWQVVDKIRLKYKQ